MSPEVETCKPRAAMEALDTFDKSLAAIKLPENTEPAAAKHKCAEEAARLVEGYRG